MADETFERFRRKLADVVTVAINRGLEVGKGKHFCPLGCAGSLLASKPWPVHAAPAWGISVNQAYQFAEGFDCNGGCGPYAELGRLYRARFP